jgi:hypothetical protein
MTYANVFDERDTLKIYIYLDMLPKRTSRFVFTKPITLKIMNMVSNSPLDHLSVLQAVDSNQIANFNHF